MYVCVCKGITDHQIKDAVYSGADTLGKLRKSLGVATQCGKCACHTREVIRETSGTAEMASGLGSPLWYAVA
ncbi:bacterioferritin-associated ferredoxin [Marinimicrobium sp. ARAG 43.8]|uniref:bacterioferritin-associated ferredoxin n=1 Tax=Marinimicrobium sp. ARAG 43.8 TaxID=3418719 RepID=UPI003CEBF861